MHTIKGRCVNVIKEMTRTENPEPYKILQLQVTKESLVHKIKGEVLSVRKATMEGRPCQAMQVLTNGAKYNRIDNLVDFDVDRKWKSGDQEFFALPRVKEKNGRVLAIYELLDEQGEFPEASSMDEYFLLQVKDYENQEWSKGEVEVGVICKPWKGRNSSGLNYRTAG